MLAGPDSFGHCWPLVHALSLTEPLLRIVLAGFGVVGSSLARLLESQRAELERAVGLIPRLVGVADSRGAAVAEHGLSAEALAAARRETGTVAGLAGHGCPGMTAQSLVARCNADVFIETTPTNLHDPSPATDRIRAALSAGVHAVSVNKGPLATAMPALLELARYNRVRLFFSGTVGAGTPMLALAQRCAMGDSVLGLRAVVNGTTNFILTRMGERRESFADALAEAVRLGYAETDPTGDTDGWDTAAKLVILANSVMGMRAGIRDVRRTGIAGVQPQDIEAAAARGRRIKLVGSATAGNGAGSIVVEPTEVEIGSALDVPGSLNAMTLTMQRTGEVTLIGRGAGGQETATAILRDLVDIWSTRP